MNNSSYLRCIVSISKDARLAKSNQDAPGVDGQSFTAIEAAGLEEWVNGLRNDLRAKTLLVPVCRSMAIRRPSGEMEGSPPR
jgi:RNA-directed DNA polymerase